MIFEDLHWIDSQTQELLDLLTESIANARVLLLFNYRPEYRHQWTNLLGEASTALAIRTLRGNPIPRSRAMLTEI